ncbi:MAG: 50S ribosomal protein L15 [Candidatus Methanomethylicota archaeon]|uniref:Large ribosomal subunit protein uL15 n=1 Tax=Thermoproteota archaeon TaxID=2056631 RepID=A0A497ER20_9CREN|nr:MAG: 50S ribosomal protein L15 [Candidatus Verstraetearchaeota archaeon]RLE50779.1 MAG: 50S ribosomal protein L15 [Candidatus Verstraetearchaeota archaeon]
MVVRRERKVRKQRGSRLYGWGQVGQHRKSGTRGGFGHAGMHKHKWSWVVKYAPDYFGKYGFIPPKKKEFFIVNVKDLETLAKFDESIGKYVVDLSQYPASKVLGEGRVSKPIKVVASAFSESAKRKILEAGGEVEVISR